ncbi:hypothetical protein J3E07_001609 [Methanococcus voltae]|uniref:PepSY domain-containing protein n=1 Tax=Methanococcus voltae TaxID=2188 RepID=A0A8J7URV4_METVO|nr:hypothetical protein [Methanococcus voltae]MBP2202168.1 hypothetical protein [Methanococcus voltae]
MKKLLFFSFIIIFTLTYTIYPYITGVSDEHIIKEQLLTLGYPKTAYIISNGTLYYSDGRKAELTTPKYYSISAYDAYNKSIDYVNTEYGEYFGQTFNIDINTLDETPEYWTYKFIFGEGSNHVGYVTVNRYTGKVSLHALNEAS